MWLPFLLTLGYYGVIAIASNLIGEALPREWFHPESILFRTHGWEKKGAIYKKFGIDAWKDRVPDMSKLRKKTMVPKRVGVCPTSESVRILVAETCRAEAVHAALCLASFVACFFWGGRVWIGLIAAVLFSLGNLPFIMIQRYNRPQLAGLAERLSEREERKRQRAAGKESDSSGADAEAE